MAAPPCRRAGAPRSTVIQAKFGIEEAPDWWSEELAAWTNNNRSYGRAFKKPASERSATEQTYAGKTTERRVALLDGIGYLD